MQRPDRIRDLLVQANLADEQARQYRRYAGYLLAQARSEAQGSEWYRDAGLDQRTAELLLGMAAGGHES